MRRLAFALCALAACAPAIVPPDGPGNHLDEDLPREPAAAAGGPAAAEPARPVAPIVTGQGARTGTIARDHLLAILDAGPGALLRQFEVAPERRADRFVGWSLVQFVDPASPLRAADLEPGDILLAINDQPLSSPDQLQKVWDSLRTANTVTAQLWRGRARLELKFAIEPPVTPPAP